MTNFDEKEKTITITNGISAIINTVAEEVSDLAIGFLLKKVFKIENINRRVNQRSKERKTTLKEKGRPTVSIVKAVEKFVDTYKTMEEMKN
jgi:hypothetical protein